jgi:signal transduction histidine kinase
MKNDPPHAPDLHVTACRALFDGAVRELGNAAANEIVVRLGGQADVLTKREAWVSLSLLECFANEVTERLGEGWIDRAVERAIDRAYGSLRARLMRLSGSPASAYRAFVHETQRTNRVMRLSLEPNGERGLSLRATPIDGAPREGTPALCRARLAHARMLGTLFDQSPADVLHARCLQYGDDACIYEITWSGAEHARIRPQSEPRAIEVMPHDVTEQEPLLIGADEIDLPGPTPDAVVALVVERDRAQRSALAAALAVRYRVRGVESGHTAVSLAGSLDPAVVVSGSLLSDMTAQELCRALRKEPRTRSTPVLIVEHALDDAARTNRTSSRPADYLRAPVAETELLARVDLHVGLRRMSQDLALSERRAMLGVTAASVAHQLRNPLTTLIAGLPAMRTRMRNRVDPQTFELVDVMIDCADRIERLSRDLMDLSRVDREPSGTFNPSDGLRSAVRLAKARVIGGVTVDDHVQDSAPIEGRAGDINHVFLNLLDNAIRAIGQNGRIRVTAAAENGFYMTRIADSGGGVDPSASERIFEPFFTTRKPGEGTGLGLAIARQIVRQHGGEISVSRSELGGALFTVQLPMPNVGDRPIATLH